MPITPKLCGRTADILYVDDDWRMVFASQWGRVQLLLAAISCVLYSPSRLRLSRCHCCARWCYFRYSAVVIGLMVQISDL